TPSSNRRLAAAIPRSDAHSSSAATPRTATPVFEKIWLACQPPNCSASCSLVNFFSGKKDLIALMAARWVMVEGYYNKGWYHPRERLSTIRSCGWDKELLWFVTQNYRTITQTLASQRLVH